MVFSDADGFIDAEEGVFGDEAVLGLAEQEADGGLVVRGFHLGIHGAEVEVELSGVLGFEGLGLEFHDDVALEPGVVKEEVEKELVAADDKLELTPDKGESRAQLQQEASDVADEGVFDVALVGLIAEAEEVEVVGIFEDFSGESSQPRRETLVEVGDGLTLAEVELVLDLDRERVARPGVLDGLLGIPFAEGGVVVLGKQGDDVEPGQFVR